MKQVTLEELLEAGCHFGHQVTRQNPKARDYVFEARDNIHIIDLEKTKEGLEEAAAFVKDLASKGGSTLLILGVKRQAQDIVKTEMQRAKSEGADGLYSVTNRWIGGTFTNLAEVAKNFKRLSEIDKLFANEYEKVKYTKKELLLMEREKQKLMVFYDGITEMKRLPEAIFIIDTHLEYLAVREAQIMNVKTVGMTDTNADPTQIDYAIPANDDAVGSIKLITSYIVDAWIEGKKVAVKAQEAAAEAVVSSAGQGAEGGRENAGAARTKDESVALSENGAKGTQQTNGTKEEKPKVPKKVVKEKAVGLSEEKKKATKKTPEKISVE